MASFGEAAAAISVTVELFNLCVEGLHAISRAKHSHKSLIDFTTRLDLEIARLVLWDSIAVNLIQALSLSNLS